MMRWPVRLEPVKLMASTSGDVVRRCATSWPLSLTRLSTPLGRLGTACRSASTAAVICAVCGERLTTVVQPAASAGVSERISSATGAFHITMMPVTPSGSLSMVENMPGSTSNTWPGI